jgi:hypothetical protein
MEGTQDPPKRTQSLGSPIRELGVYHLPHGLKNLLFCESSSPNKVALYYAEISYRTRPKPGVPDVKLYSLPSSVSIETSSCTRPSAEICNPRSNKLKRSSHDSATAFDGTKISGDTARAQGQVVAAAWFRNVLKTHKIRLCLGDPEKVRGVVWAEMTDVQKHRHGEYVIRVPEEGSGGNLMDDVLGAEMGKGVQNQFETGFETGFQGGYDAPKEMQTTSKVRAEEGKTFRWLRTHAKEDGLENGTLSRKWSVANFKLVDETGRAVAVFESNGLKSFRKIGKLKIYRTGVDGHHRFDTDLGNNAIVAGRSDGDLQEVMMVLSYCVIAEKYRRGV